MYFGDLNFSGDIYAEVCGDHYGQRDEDDGPVELVPAPYLGSVEHKDWQHVERREEEVEVGAEVSRLEDYHAVRIHEQEGQEEQGYDDVRERPCQRDDAVLLLRDPVPMM